MSHRQGSGAALCGKAMRGRLWTCVAAVVLFLASAAAVVWQNSRLTVLWDVSYILETASRIAAGDMPYRDFAIPYAPLTFLMQAAIIKLFGRVFWHHILYAAVMGGAASLVGWRILLCQFRGKLQQANLAAFLLALPLIPLGIYAIFPHPFYDCDATLVILAGLWLLYWLDAHGWPLTTAFATGIVLVLPVFIKQNTGLVFTVAAMVAIAVLAVIDYLQGRSWAGKCSLLVGAAMAVLAALRILQATVGLGGYLHWTVAFAGSRRLPGLAEMLGVYRIVALPAWLALAACGVLLLRFTPKMLSFAPVSWRESRLRYRAIRLGARATAALLLLTPYLWSVIYLLIDGDASERTERLLALWPYTLILAFVFALWQIKRGGVASAIPFILLVTVHGAFLSQQLWGSTYALWPFLLILCGDSIVNLRAICNHGEFGQAEPSADGPSCDDLCDGSKSNGCAVIDYRGNSLKFSDGRKPAWTLSIALLSLTLFVSGGFYSLSHERLSYVNLDDGELRHSQLPALRGLAMSGDYLPQFEELVRYTDANIPRSDGILMLPGEDLFYFTTGRRPHFPVLMFDHTVNPYDPAEIVELASQRDIRWVIVKKNPQLGEVPFAAEEDTLVRLNAAGFRVHEALDNYLIYHRER